MMVTNSHQVGGYEPMERQAMYQFLQACLTGKTDYSTEGVTFYRAPTSGERQHAIVLDVLIDRYLSRPGQTIELSVPDIAVSIDVSADEIVRSVLALARITLVSQHIEERLIRVVSAGIDEAGHLTLVIGFNAWLTHHLDYLSGEWVELPPRVHAM
ncbi:hypothetical protein [Exiguobacterium aurantiacum]|uniref:hypothetical protein n=1 Tax=Exiguobacterium aurantiacum TaxID=33987 RepID=UPI00384FAE59